MSPQCCADIDRNRSPQSCQDAQVESKLYLGKASWAKAEDGVCYSDGLPFNHEVCQGRGLLVGNMMSAITVVFQGTIQSTAACQTGPLEQVQQVCAFNNARLCHWTDLNRVTSSSYVCSLCQRLCQPPYFVANALLQ